MKKILFLLFLVSSIASAQEADYRTLSENILQQFQKKEFQKIYDQIDAKVFTKLDTARLAAIWNGVIKQSGEFKKRISAEEGMQGEFHTYVQLLQFEKKQANLRLIWSSDKKIKGLYFLPVDNRPQYHVPDYHNPAAATDKKFFLVTDNYRLPGTLTVPNTPGKHPVVILVHGSGPNDRDESFGPLKIFRDLASGLSAKGIAVMRYEKRTKLYNSRMKHEASTYTIREEVLQDIQKAIEAAKKDSSIDSNQIFLCGHSFGGMLLPKIAQENPGLKGLIYLAANGRKLEDLFLAQAEYIAESMDDAVKKKQMVDSVKVQRERIKLLNDKAVNDSAAIFQSPSSYWYSLKNYDAIATAKSLKMPMYFVYGLRDYQVTTTDAQMWQNAFKENKSVEFKMYPKLNHFFVSGEGKSVPKEYEKPGNVDLSVITDMVNWINATK